MIESGQVLLWTGDYRNGRQLLSAIGRRLNKMATRPAGNDLWSRWKSERAATRARGETLGQVLVLLEPDGELKLRRAPDTRRAVELAWGLSDQPRVVALNTLVGALGAAEWTSKGLDVPGLEGRIVPRFGVFSPTRRAYVDLLENLDVRGRSVLDVGCGTGVLGFVLLQRGASHALGTDCEERAVGCAMDNATQLGLLGQYQAVRADLFPAEPEASRFDVIVFNAPWVPETPRTALDRAVFDDNGDTLRSFLRRAPGHLAEGGVIALMISDLPERLGLRAPEALESLMAEEGLAIQSSHSVHASHRRAKDTDDPLHEARGAERMQLFVVTPYAAT
ncbi:MAG: polypeptide subunit release factor methylase [Planctomycetota bacterium]|jgi:methylase of polypeptide subunit release factors